MAKQGILAQSKPAANTDTVLYTAPIDQSASVALTVANDGTGSTFDVAIKDYSQKLTVDGSGAYLLHPGDIITGYKMTVNTAFTPDSSGFSPGLQITSVDREKTFRYESVITPAFEEIFVKASAIRAVGIESVSGTFVVGDTLTKGTSPNATTAVVFGVAGSIISIGPSTLNGTGTEFTDGDTISGTGGATASISTGGVGSASNKFIFSNTTVGGTYDLFLVSGNNTLQLFNDRTVRFNVSDSSMSSHLLQFSTDFNGEWGADGIFGGSSTDDGTEYATGKTVSGTAGSSGAYVQLVLSTATPALLYWYNGTTGTAANSSFGGSDAFVQTDSTPTFKEFFVYDVDGTWANSTDTFTVGGVTYTVTAQTVEPYGYVRSYSGTTLYVCKGIGSGDFAGTDTFQDNPKLITGTRSTVTVSSVDVAVAAAEAENYIVVNHANAANNDEKLTSLVVGPGEVVIVNSTTQNNVFTLLGFEDSTSSFTTRMYGN